VGGVVSALSRHPAQSLDAAVQPSKAAVRCHCEIRRSLDA
jgi:hypothetical protein